MSGHFHRFKAPPKPKPKWLRAVDAFYAFTWSPVLLGIALGLLLGSLTFPPTSAEKWSCLGWSFAALLVSRFQPFSRGGDEA